MRRRWGWVWCWEGGRKEILESLEFLEVLDIPGKSWVAGHGAGGGKGGQKSGVQKKRVAKGEGGR